MSVLVTVLVTVLTKTLILPPNGGEYGDQYGSMGEYGEYGEYGGEYTYPASLGGNKNKQMVGAIAPIGAIAPV